MRRRDSQLVGFLKYVERRMHPLVIASTNFDKFVAVIVEHSPEAYLSRTWIPYEGVTYNAVGSEGGSSAVCTVHPQVQGFD